MKDITSLTIEIPQGCFEGNCCDCKFTEWHDRDSYDRVYCAKGYGYNHPSDRNGCFGYEYINS